MSYIIVAGVSMEPTLYSGDLVVVRSGDYRLGDVVAFDSGESVVIHRIIGGDPDEGFLLQGDNKPEPDRWRPGGDDILGKQILRIPGAGAHLATVLGSPMLLGGIFGGLGTLMVWSPARRRRRHGAHEADGVTRRSTTTTSHAPKAGPVLVGIGGLTFLLAALSLYVGLQPLEVLREIERPLFEHSATHGYVVSVDPSVVYEGTTVTPDSTGDESTAIFTELLNEMWIEFTYEIGSGAFPPTGGELTSELRIGSGENRWTRTIPLLPATTFQANSASETFSLDVAQIRTLIARAEEETGYSPSAYELRVVTRVEPDHPGIDEGAALEVLLPMRLTDTALVIENSSVVSEAVTTSEPSMVENEIGIFDVALPVRHARTIAFTLLGLLLLTGAIYAVIVRQRLGTGELARIRLRYGPLIVPISRSTPNGANQVTVNSIDDLAKLARRAEQAIFHDQSEEQRFFVPDGSVTYEYRIGKRHGRGR